jgi:hypothetical protein
MYVAGLASEEKVAAWLGQHGLKREQYSFSVAIESPTVQIKV